MLDNRHAIEHSTLCGCARGTALFKPDAILSWHNSNQGLDDDIYDWEGVSEKYAETYEASTALCPHCNGPGVVCNANLPELSAQTLTDLHRLFFSGTRTAASSPAPPRQTPARPQNRRSTRSHNVKNTPHQPIHRFQPQANTGFIAPW